MSKRETDGNRNPEPNEKARRVPPSEAGFWRNAGTMSLEGRMEKRHPLGIRLYLVCSAEQPEPESVVTENVSSRGARVLGARRWQPGERPLLTPFSRAFQLPARVVYCQNLPNGLYRLGLDFRGTPINWGEDCWGSKT